MYKKATKHDKEIATAAFNLGVHVGRCERKNPVRIKIKRYRRRLKHTKGTRWSYPGTTSVLMTIKGRWKVVAKFKSYAAALEFLEQYFEVGRILNNTIKWI